MAVLADLEKIPWANHEHDYGLATDVPDMIRQLTSHDKVTCRHAAHTLRITALGTEPEEDILHSFVVFLPPFLIELLQSPIAIHKEPILHVLSALAAEDTGLYKNAREGNTAWHASYKISLQEMGELDQAIAEAKQIHETIRAGLPIYEQLRNSDDAEVSQAAAKLIAAVLSRA
ncbi:MAG TPA: hypothetical protein VKY74_01025 [Chloroflexia bacterium]|nr:hypothetical protein [Chloroflexia bacterium]